MPNLATSDSSNTHECFGLAFGRSKKWRNTASASGPSLLALCQAVCHAGLAPDPLCRFSLGGAPSGCSFHLGALGAIT